MEDCKLLAADWEGIVEEQGRLLRSILVGTRVGVAENDSLSIYFKDPYNFSIADKTNRAEEIREILKNKYEKEFRITLKCLKVNEAAPRAVLGKKIPGIEMEIEE